MDIVWNRNKRKIRFLKNKSGQSTIEYILLILVVTSLFTALVNSRGFKQFFGPNSDFFTAFTERIRLNYRYSTPISIDDEIGIDAVLTHPSFYNKEASESRFFTYKSDRYPDK